MNTTKNIFIALIFTSWIILVATFSIQNIELISLKFFFLESIEIPIGVLLSIMASAGFIFGAIIPALFSGKKKSKKKKQKARFYREEEEKEDPIFDW